LRYTPNEKARTIAMAKRFSIGFFIPHSGYLSSDAYIIRIIEGMTPVLNKNRFQLVLQPLKLQEMNYLQLARHDAVDGIILMNVHDDDEGLVQVIEAGFPLVVIGSIKNRDVCQIDIDNRSSAAAAVNYLIDLGHRDIGMIIHAPVSYYAARHRYDGYRQAIESAGYRIRKRWVQEANLTEESGYRAMNEILEQNRRPTAVFAGNDVVAYGAIQAIKDKGLRIPDDMSVVGFDDDSLSRYLNPPLTTMTNPAASLGAEAASRIVKVMKGRPPAELSRLVPTSLAVRDSCGELRSREAGTR
jgi:LacI family transcriptional regulator